MNKFLGIVFALCCLTLPRGWSQTDKIIVKDQIDLHRVSQVNISFLGKKDQLLGQYQSAGDGTVQIPDSLENRIETIQLTHEDYKPSRISFAALVQQQYIVFIEPQTFLLDDVVFTANKYKEQKADIPYQINILKLQDIQLQNPQTSADLLTHAGQVFVQKSQQGGGSPNLRGFEANKVLLVIDGVRMNNAIYRSGHLQNVITIDPELVDRTEVMFGPSSVMYGSDALGGVMHFYTTQPVLSNSDKMQLTGRSLLRYGSANHEKTANVQLNMGFQKWGLLTSFTVKDFDDLRVGARRLAAYPEFGKRNFYIDPSSGNDSIVQNDDPDIMRFSGYTQYDFSQKISYLPNEKVSHNLNLQFSNSSIVPRFDRLTQLSDSRLRFAEWNYGPQKRFLAAYTLKLFAKKGLYDQLTLITAYQDIEESRILRERLASIRNNRIERVKIASINLDANKVFHKDHELAYGLELNYNDITSTAFTEDILSGEKGNLDTRYPDGGSHMQTFAAYFTHRWELKDWLMLTDGIRLTNVGLTARFIDKQFFPLPIDHAAYQTSALSGNLGLVLKPAEEWRISLLGATGFRAPNLDDVAKVFDSQPGNVVVPNADLKPEYTYTTELGISKRWKESFKVDIIGFYTWYLDAIVVRDFSLNGADSILYDGVMSKVQANVNAGKAFITGISTLVEGKIGPFRLSNSLTYTYGQELSTNVPMDHIPPLFGRLSISHEIKRLRSSFYLNYNGWKRKNRFSPRDFNNAEFATIDGWPAWMTLNAKTSFSFSSGLQLQLGVENLLDQHYRPFQSRISAPGRNVSIALRVHF